MSLRTGTELITLSLLLNKVSGLYGLLALLTGFALSPLQLSMYIYSVLALVLTAFLSPHIRKQSPLQCLALAWVYILDSAVNAVYTAAFAVTWFLVISQHHSDAATSSAVASSGGAGKTMDTAAGFTSPEFNVSHVDVVAAPAAGLLTGQDAVAVGSPGRSTSTTTNPSLGHGVLQPESVPSIVVISLLWAARVYFVLVVMAYASSVLRHHLRSMSVARPSSPSKAGVGDMGLNPFAIGTQEGQGWRGRLGRAMVAVGRSYWLGGDEEDDSWADGLGGKFRKTADVPGVFERERRRRSGTDPPVPTTLELPRWQTGSS